MRTEKEQNFSLQIKKEGQSMRMNLLNGSLQRFKEKKLTISLKVNSKIATWLNISEILGR